MRFPTRHSKKTEKSLWRRLKFLGYLLLVFSFLFLIYAFVLTSKQKKEDFDAVPEGLAVEFLHKEKEDLAEETLNFFLISVVFSLVGTTCLITFKKKQAQEFLENSRSKDKKSHN
jgi:nucleoside recognition membrane protein YjiH